MASGIRLSKSGRSVGTGANLAISLPFPNPSYVKVWNLSSGDVLEWNVSMGNGTGFKRVAAGTGSFITTGGITPTASGFTLGTDADMNVSGEQLAYYAEE